MVEEWRDVEGWEGKYQVSNLGRARSLDRITSDGRKWKGRMLKLMVGTTGYPYFHAYKQGFSKKPIKMWLHQEIAKAFIPNPDNKKEIDHIDAVRSNNVVSNLRWATRSENQMNPITRQRQSESHKGQICTEETRRKLAKPRPGLQNGKNPQAKAVRNLDTGEIFETLKLAGLSIGRAYNTIAFAIKNKSRSGGFRWCFVGEE